jgi:hypothetical protein
MKKTEKVKRIIPRFIHPLFDMDSSLKGSRAMFSENLSIVSRELPLCSNTLSTQARSDFLSSTGML